MTKYEKVKYLLVKHIAPGYQVINNIYKLTGEI